MKDARTRMIGELLATRFIVSPSMLLSNQNGCFFVDGVLDVIAGCGSTGDVTNGIVDDMILQVLLSQYLLAGDSPVNFT